VVITDRRRYPAGEPGPGSADSCGRQLGRIIDVLGELIERWPDGVPDDPSVQRFAELRVISRRSRLGALSRTIAELAEMKQRNPDEYTWLARTCGDPGCQLG
jgi:hypothetical protein